MLLRRLESSSSQVSTTMPFPTAWIIAGTLLESQVSPNSAVQPWVVLWESSQLLGITNARFGSVPPERSAARSE